MTVAIAINFNRRSAASTGLSSSKALVSMAAGCTCSGNGQKPMCRTYATSGSTNVIAKIERRIPFATAKKKQRELAI